MRRLSIISIYGHTLEQEFAVDIVYYVNSHKIPIIVIISIVNSYLRCFLALGLLVGACLFRLFLSSSSLSWS